MNDPDLVERARKLIDLDLPKNQELIPNVIVAQEPVGPEEPELHVRELVTHLNYEYLFRGEYPRLGQLRTELPFLAKLSAPSLKKLFKEANKILEEKRDLPPYEVQFRNEKSWDPKFIAALNLILNPTDRRSVNAKLKDVGLTPTKWGNFLKIKKYREFYENQISRNFTEDTYLEGQIALGRNVASGDLPSIRYFNEMTGKYVPQKDFDPRIISYLMQALLEIVIKHTNGEQARLIADEMEKLSILDVQESAVKELK